MAVRERVLVAGAGPVGLVAATHLARSGVPVTVFEQGAGLSEESRASTFHPPTLDMLDALGAAEQGLRARQNHARLGDHRRNWTGAGTRQRTGRRDCWQDGERGFVSWRMRKLPQARRYRRHSCAVVLSAASRRRSFAPRAGKSCGARGGCAVEPPALGVNFGAGRAIMTIGGVLS